MAASPPSVHRTFIASLCRLCGSCFQRRGIPKLKLASVIRRALSLNVVDDIADIHPTFVCELCDRKLHRWNLKARKRTGALFGTQIDIEIPDFQEHSGCSCPCSSVDAGKEPDLLSEGLKLGQEFGLLVSKRSGKILFLSVNDEGITTKCLSLRENGQWALNVHGRQVHVDRENTQFASIPSIITMESLPEVLQTVATSHVCLGNPEYVVPESILQNKPAYVHHLPTSSTVRHSSCPLILSPDREMGGATRCNACKIYRNDLNQIHKRFNVMVSPAPKTNYKYVKPVKLAKKLRQSAEEKKCLKRKIKKLEKRIERMFREEAETVSDHNHSAFKEVFLKENKSDLEFPEGSPQDLLWKEQAKCLKRDPKGMRWHPAILRLCIALVAKSKAAYELLRDSGYITLPHTRTLQHYTHFTTNNPGFHKQLFDRVCSDIKFPELKEYQKNVILTFDEMKISSGLVYSHTTGEITGFTSLGTFNDELREYARKSNPITSNGPELATHVIVIMVRAICASYRVPVVYFATTSATGDELYAMIMQTLEYLELYGFKVRGLTSDGATTNRGLYKLLTSSSPQDFHFTNPFTGKLIYLFSDAPHLLKTARNNLENSGFNRKTRNMKFRGLEVSWKHIIDVYEWDLGKGPASLRMLHRLSEEHVRLTPSHRMKVKLAAQVLSSTVANALKLQGNDHTSSTVTFIEHMDLFFDCLNVSSLHGGTKKKKDGLEPYRDVDDWRFTWLEEGFLFFLEEWESEGRLFPITSSEREKLCLSRQTLQGIRLTGLPVTLSHSGFLPFLVSFLVGFVVQALLIYFFMDVLQRAHAYNIEKHKCLSFEEQQVPLTNLADDEELNHGTSKAGRNSLRRIARKVAKPNLHMMGTLFLGRGLSQAFDIVLLLQFVSILISYALAGSEAYAQLLHIEKYLYIIPAFVWILSGSIVFAQRVIQPVVSLFTLAKGGLLVATVIVTFGVGSAVGNTITNDFHYMGSPFLMGTVALGGVCNVMPMMYSRIAYSRKHICSFWWTVFAGLATCMILNVLWCWAVLDIVPQLSSCTTHVTEEVTIHENTTVVNIFTTPSVSPCVEDLSLERSAKQGEISTVPLIEILEDDYPQYTWVAILVELFIMISITVSYLTIGSAMLHSFLGWLDAHMAWDKVDKGNTVPAKVKYCPKRICRPLLSLLVFGLVFAVAMLDPKGFVTMLDKIASLLLNLEAGLFIFLMIRRSNSAKYRSLIIPYPIHRYIYPTHYIIAIYFLFAVVYDITIMAIEWFT